MRLLSLRVSNFGLFDGLHEFDLSVQGVKNVVIFKGHNGAGKSTLFQALTVGLYGALALGDRVTVAKYQGFLYEKIHRKKYGERGRSQIAASASVVVAFEYVRSGQPSVVSVERTWNRNGRVIEEKLRVLVDNVPPDVPQADYQLFVLDLVPPGMMTLCFFDAERLGLRDPGDWDQTGSGRTQIDRLVQYALHRLLGLDLVTRLQDDLDYFLAKRGNSSSKVDNIRESVLYHQAEVERLTEYLATLDSEYESLSEREQYLRAKFNEQEREIALAGGTFAERRPMLEHRLNELDTDIAQTNDQVEILASGLLPFMFANTLCQQLAGRLIYEKDMHRLALGDEVWRHKLDDLSSVLVSSDFWNGIDIVDSARAQIIGRFEEALQAPMQAQESLYDTRHPISDEEQDQIIRWVTEVCDRMPDQVAVLSAKLLALHGERDSIVINMNRAPERASLEPMELALQAIADGLRVVGKRRSDLLQQIGATKFQLENQIRKRTQAAAELDSLNADSQQNSLAVRTKAALRSYYQALLIRKLKELEEALRQRFNSMCSKDRLISAVDIDPESFAITLEGVDGLQVSLSSFSAGEQQLFVMAVLSALREISGRSLPLVIDTPMARLDREHKTRLLVEYLPIVSNQVILFGTDLEFEDDVIDQLDSVTAHAYTLWYDSSSQATLVHAVQNSPEARPKCP